MKRLIWLLILLIGCSNIPQSVEKKEADPTGTDFMMRYLECNDLHEEKKWDEIIQIGNTLAKNYNFFNQGLAGEGMFYHIATAYRYKFSKEDKFQYAEFAINNYESWIESIEDKKNKGLGHYFIASVYRELNKNAYEEKIFFHARKAIEYGEEKNGNWILAITLCDKSNYKEALDCIDKAVEGGPNRAWNYVIKGRILRKMERFKEAEHSLNTAEVLDPKNEQLIKEKKWLEEAKNESLGNALELKIDGIYKCPKCGKDIQFKYTSPIDTVFSLGIRFRCPHCGYNLYTTWKEEK